jgi:hypothetical protein
MTNRRKYHKRTAKDVKADGRYVSLKEHMLACQAWRSLDSNSKMLYAELARRYRGPNSNNGRIAYSVREAARALSISRATAQRCFEKLIDRGFTKIGKRSGFSMKGRVATEWLLSEFPDDTTASTGIASKDFMKWTPDLNHSPAVRKKPTALDRLRTAWKAATADERAEFTRTLNSSHSLTSEPLNSNHSLTRVTDSLTTEPGVALRRDCVAKEQRLWPSGETVSPEFTGPQSHQEDTTHLPGVFEIIQALPACVVMEYSDIPATEQRAGEARYPNSAVASPPAETRPQAYRSESGKPECSAELDAIIRRKWGQA